MNDGPDPRPTTPLPDSLDPRAQQALASIEARSGIRFADYRDTEAVGALLQTMRAVAGAPGITLRNWLLYGGLVVLAHASVFLAVSVGAGLFSLLGLVFASVIVPFVVVCATLRQLVRAVLDGALATTDHVVTLVGLVMRDIRAGGGARLPTIDIVRGVYFGVVLPVVQREIEGRIPLVGRFVSGPLAGRITSYLLRDTLNEVGPDDAVQVTGEGLDDDGRRRIRAQVSGLVERMRGTILLPLTIFWVLSLVPLTVYLCVVFGMAFFG